MSPQYTEDDVRSALKRYIEKCGSQAEAAKKLGISEPYISQLVNGTRSITSELAAQLGFVKKSVFEA